jgi:hypothetical protein
VFETIYSQIVTGVALLVVAFAFIKGDEPERIGAATYAIVSLAAAIMLGDPGSRGPLWGLKALDVVQLAVFVGLAWHSRRAWPVWASAFQALIVTGHLLMAFNLQSSTDALFAFAAMNNLANYALLITLAVGTFWAWQERRAAAMGSDTTRPPRL